ncbi:MAG: DUF2162 domain-containing protein [Halobacteria archaeon]
MNEIILLIGVLLSVAVLGVKAGVGCGFASLKKREIGFIAISYLGICISINYLIAAIPLDLMQQILGLGVVLHLGIAIALLYEGLRTVKNWMAKGCDISRRTFIWLAVPCPACLAATFLACLLLSRANFSTLFIGAITGSIFIIAIFSIALLASKLGRSPSRLGNAMIFIGLFYILSILIIPAYLAAKEVIVPEIQIEWNMVWISILAMLLLISTGFILHWRRVKWTSHLL